MGKPELATNLGPQDVVVLVTPDLEAQHLAIELLRASQLHVKGYASATSFLSDVTAPGPQCAAIDGALSDMGCTQVQAEFARRGLRTQVVFLLADHQLELAVAVVKAGAADVLLKPVDARELRRRVHAVLSRGQQAELATKVARERLGNLTGREFEVVGLVTSGLSNKGVADRLQISFRTVEVHRRNAMIKTGCGNIVELTHLVTNVGRHALPSAAFPPSLLTEREREVLRLGTDGLSNKGVAHRLAISTRTVEAHRSNAHRKSDGSPVEAEPSAPDPQLSLWPRDGERVADEAPRRLEHAGTRSGPAPAAVGTPTVEPSPLGTPAVTSQIAPTGADTLQQP